MGEVTTTPTSPSRMVVATTESLVHRFITSPSPVDPQRLEDEIVVLLEGYLRDVAAADTPPALN